jgi:hypothetical protein
MDEAIDSLEWCPPPEYILPILDKEAGVDNPPVESAISAACARLAPHRKHDTFFAKLWYPQPSAPHFQSPARKGTFPAILEEREP